MLNEADTRNELMERAGTGIKRIRDACALNKNKVEIKPLDTYFFVEISHSKDYLRLEGATQKTTQKIIERINENPSITRKELAEAIGDITEDGVKYNLNKLVKEKIIKRVGPDKGGYWEVKDE